MRKLDKPYSGSDFSRYQEVFFPRMSKNVYGRSYRVEADNADWKWAVFFGIVLAIVALVLL